MLITLSGLHGTGKTTVAKLLAERYGLPHLSTGIVFREMAAEKRMGLVEFSDYAAKHHEIDRQLDNKMRERGLKGNVVLDGQLCWFFLRGEADWKVLLLCDDAARIQRIYERDRTVGGPNITLESARKETLERERIEQERYKEIYGIDLSDSEFVKKSHNIVVDTTHLTIKEVVQTVVSRIHPRG
ncbi:MAG: AAA family ATPase [Candidatus Lokiarchaeota archaeon]|nr:AAA family ATPase [Candidatus Lokiarchaeota archaeon]